MDAVVSSCIPRVSQRAGCDVVIVVVASGSLLKYAVRLLAIGDAGVSQCLINSRTLSIRLVCVRPRARWRVSKFSDPRLVEEDRLVEIYSGTFYSRS